MEESIDPADIRAIGPEASYYLGIHLELSGMEEDALDMYRSAAEKSFSTVRLRAQRAYLRLLVKLERYADVERKASEYLDESGNGKVDVGLLVELYRALAGQNDHEGLHRTVARYGDRSFEGAPSGDGRRLQAAADFYALWDARNRENRPRPEMLLAYMAAYSRSVLPPEAFILLGYPEAIPLVDLGQGDEEEGARAAFSLIGDEAFDYTGVDPGMEDFLKAKMLLATGEYGKAFERYSGYLDSVDKSSSGRDRARLFTSIPGDEFVRSVLYSGRLYDGVDHVEAARKRLESIRIEPDLLFWFLETEAYLKRRLGRYSEAVKLYERALSIAPRSEAERMRWYRYDSLVRIDPESAVEELLQVSARWKNPAYYNDVLFDLADRLVRMRRWEQIGRAADILARTSSSFAAARFSYLAARASEAGFFPAGEEHITFWYDHALKSGCGAGAANYYRIMAEERLEIMGIHHSRSADQWWPFCREEDGGGSSDTGIMNTASESYGEEASKMIAGYLRYGLSEYAYRRYGEIHSLLGKLPRFLVRLWAQHLQRRDKYLESVRLITRYYEETGKAIEDEDVRLLYPKAYDGIMQEVSRRHDFPDYLLFALVREESLFTADISSSAGAVGLSQLMPSTAGDVATRIGMRITDLTDPSENLTIGGWYLDHLIGRTDSYSRALFSYNGGITRVRRWVRNNPDLPGDLLLEAIPYKETSHYGRKVLVSAVVYGYIYRGIPIEDIIESFFITHKGSREQS